MGSAAATALLQEYEQRLRELSHLRASGPTEVKGTAKRHRTLLAVAKRLRARCAGRAGNEETAFDQSPLIRQEGRRRFDLAPFLYSMPEMAFWDARRILLPVLGNIAFSGGERVRRELESQFLGVIAEFSELGAGGGILARSTPKVLDSVGGVEPWSREVGQDFLSPFSYHPIVPQLLRDVSAPFRHGLLDGPWGGDRRALGDLPGELTLSGDSLKALIHVPELDSRVLPRLVPVCEQLPVDRRKLELQTPGLRSGLKDLVSDWQASEAVRRELLCSASSTLRGMPEAHVELSPAVTVVVATRRPDFLAKVLSTYQRQTYRDKELVLVCHGFSREQVVQHAASEGISAKVIEVDPQFNLGRCLNEGIRNGSGTVWMKMDDDDLYGPNYVEDNVNLLVCTRADILARPLMVAHQHSNWVYDEDKVARTNVLVEESDPSGHMCGATLTGWVDPARFCGFDERLRRGVDSELLQRAQRSGLRLVSVNIPGYACIRYPESDHHTWKEWRAAGKVIRDQDAKQWLGTNDFQLEMPA